MLFADDAAVTTHTQQELQALMDRFSQACKDFGLTISLKKTKVLGQDTIELPAIPIDDYELDVVEQFTYHGSTITDNLSLDSENEKRIPKDILHGDLSSGGRTRGHPQLRYKDVCKRDTNALEINTEFWEDLAADRLR